MRSIFGYSLIIIFIFGSYSNLAMENKENISPNIIKSQEYSVKTSSKKNNNNQSDTLIKIKLENPSTMTKKHGKEPVDFRLKFLKQQARHNEVILRQKQA